MWKQQDTNSSSAEVCLGVLGRSGFIDFLPDVKHLSGVQESAFADILGKVPSLSTQVWLVKLHVDPVKVWASPN